MDSLALLKLRAVKDRIYEQTVNEVVESVEETMRGETEFFVCRTCFQKKPTSEFYKYTQNKRGFRGSCKECTNREYEKSFHDRVEKWYKEKIFPKYGLDNEYTAKDLQKDLEISLTYARRIGRKLEEMNLVKVTKDGLTKIYRNTP